MSCHHHHHRVPFKKKTKYGVSGGIPSTTFNSVGGMDGFMYDGNTAWESAYFAAFGLTGIFNLLRQQKKLLSTGFIIHTLQQQQSPNDSGSSSSSTTTTKEDKETEPVSIHTNVSINNNNSTNTSPSPEHILWLQMNMDDQGICNDIMNSNNNTTRSAIEYELNHTDEINRDELEDLQTNAPFSRIWGILAGTTDIIIQLSGLDLLSPENIQWFNKTMNDIFNSSSKSEEGVDQDQDKDKDQGGDNGNCCEDTKAEQKKMKEKMDRLSKGLNMSRLGTLLSLLKGKIGEWIQKMLKDLKQLFGDLTYWLNKSWGAFKWIMKRIFKFVIFLIRMTVTLLKRLFFMLWNRIQQYRLSEPTNDPMTPIILANQRRNAIHIIDVAKSAINPIDEDVLQNQNSFDLFFNMQNSKPPLVPSMAFLLYVSRHNNVS